MEIESDRIKIIALRQEMTEAIQKNSIDEDNRRFLPDEVFETVAEAQRAVKHLIACYDGPYGPFVYPVLIKGAKPGEGEINAGTIEACKIDQGWEIGFHIAKPHTSRGYATEALAAFLPVIMEKLAQKRVYGVVCEENIPSQRVLEKCGFKMIQQGLGLYQGETKRVKTYVFEKAAQSIPVF